MRRQETKRKDCVKMKPKAVDLCGRCAAIVGEHYEIKRVAGGRDHKVFCEQCRRMRYGGTYEIGKKVKEK